ncbi:energy-coupling factor transporter transmembrane component T [Methanoregula sp.]|uniref:energy-coupling factor transporter transmembrane component T family protein n=1 Tax=Methanoregula sp. TaxID=2052170 RepID=UPI002C5F7A75|nr:energy-coupling factor transporter transmembrane component T [Methanoregula sp.]HVP96122.1 energy-coupling factor transporter transmembrane component T [Methanoregula sp.]
MAEILQYVHKDGLFHRLTPFSKILLIIVVAVMCVIATGIPFLLLMVAALLALAYASDLLRELLQQLRLLLVMSVVFIVITVLTMPNGATLGTLVPPGVPVIGGAIPVTTGAVIIGIILALRFMVLIFAFQLFLISTQPRDLVHTLERLHMPVDYILMFIIALRFIPTLQIEGTRIHEAQLARGYNPGTGLLGKVRSVQPIVVPLVSNALLRSTVLGLTIDMRGYRTGTRTRVRERRFGTVDYLLITSISVVAAAFAVAVFLAPGLVF